MRGPKSPAPSKQSFHSLTDYSFSTSKPGSPTPQQLAHLNLGVPPNHSSWLKLPTVSSTFQQQPLSLQLGQPTQPQHKLPLTSMLCTTNAALQSQAITACSLGQRQGSYILTQSLAATLTFTLLFRAVSKPPVHAATSMVTL